MMSDESLPLGDTFQIIPLTELILSSKHIVSRMSILLYAVDLRTNMIQNFYRDVRCCEFQVKDERGVGRQARL